MIKGVHTMFYTSDAEALRAFLRDVIGFSFTDVGGGWLIFDLPEADMGCHPAREGDEDGRPVGTHEVSFYCDNIRRTVGELEARGVQFTEPITETEYGLSTYFLMPGDVRTQLYQPHYEKRAPSR